MFLFENLDREITTQLRQEEQDNASKHVSSGKLSASMLGEPLQWQVLKTLGIGNRQVGDYLLRKFEVGRDTEDWFLRRVSQQVLERQKFLEYRGAIGYADAIVNAEIAHHDGVQVHTIPLEVKSTSNAKFKRLMQMADADEMHKLQAAFYALAMGSDYYGITYIAADDRRTHTWIYTTKDMQQKIDEIIVTYNTQLALQEVPIFKARYSWQANVEYNKYPEWINLNEVEIKMAMGLYHPTAWEDYAKKATAKAGA